MQSRMGVQSGNLHAWTYHLICNSFESFFLYLNFLSLSISSFFFLPWPLELLDCLAFFAFDLKSWILKYAKDLLRRASMLDSKPIGSPSSYKPSSPASSTLMVDPTLYRNIAGSLQYLFSHSTRFSICNQSSLSTYAPAIHSPSHWTEENTSLTKGNSYLWDSPY